MKTTKEMIEVMKAFDEGKEIESRSYKTDWGDANSPCWNWYDFDYRIKPEHKTRLMTFDEIVDYWKQHRTEMFHYNKYTNEEQGFITSVEYNAEIITLCGYQLSVDEVYRLVTKEDGSKFEVEE